MQPVEVTDAAWEVIQGAVDVQVHVWPDLVERRTDDIDLAKDFLRTGLAGFVLKSHYQPTAERASVVRTAVPGIEAHGAVTLNHGVGGLNPIAVEIAGRSGAKFVWFPTFDSINEADMLERNMASPPVWVAIQREMIQRGLRRPSIEILDEDGNVTKDAIDCLRVAADYDMTVASGHMGQAETFALVKAAKANGVAEVVVTHAEFPSQNFSTDQQRELAQLGAVIEHCYTTAHTGKCAWEDMLANIMAVGPERTVISTDLGQVPNPPVAAGLAEFAQRLLDVGCPPHDIRRMAVENSRRLIGLSTSVPA